MCVNIFKQESLFFCLIDIKICNLCLFVCVYECGDVLDVFAVVKFWCLYEEMKIKKPIVQQISPYSCILIHILLHMYQYFSMLY